MCGCCSAMPMFCALVALTAAGIGLAVLVYAILGK